MLLSRNFVVIAQALIFGLVSPGFQAPPKNSHPESPKIVHADFLLTGEIKNRVADSPYPKNLLRLFLP